MDDLSSQWQHKGATLSDKTAREEFGLTQDEIVRAIRAGKLQYREGSMYGNPWLRLLRRELEALVRKNHGDGYLVERQEKAELARIGYSGRCEWTFRWDVNKNSGRMGIGIPLA